jgi:hypothetical protein
MLQGLHAKLDPEFSHIPAAEGVSGVAYALVESAYAAPQHYSAGPLLEQILNHYSLVCYSGEFQRHTLPRLPPQRRPYNIIAR